MLQDSRAYFNRAADVLDLPDRLRAILVSPLRVVKVELVYDDDSGKLQQCFGYRVQHNRARGPMKGGLRFHPTMDEDHAAALCETMALLAEDGELESLQTQAEFFRAHIGPWMARFFRDMQEATSARFYRAVGQLGEQFIETDQRYLEMVERPEAIPAESNGSGHS